MESNLEKILIKALGIENASKEMQDKVMQGMGSIILQSAITRAFEEMNEETLTLYEKLTETKPNPDEILEFFLLNIPNFEQMMQEEATKVIGNSVNMINEVQS